MGIGFFDLFELFDRLQEKPPKERTVEWFITACSAYSRARATGWPDSDTYSGERVYDIGVWIPLFRLLLLPLHTEE